MPPKIPRHEALLLKNLRRSPTGITFYLYKNEVSSLRPTCNRIWQHFGIQSSVYFWWLLFSENSMWKSGQSLKNLVRFFLHVWRRNKIDQNISAIVTQNTVLKNLYVLVRTWLMHNRRSHPLPSGVAQHAASPPPVLPHWTTMDHGNDENAAVAGTAVDCGVAFPVPDWPWSCVERLRPGRRCFDCVSADNTAGRGSSGWRRSGAANCAD